MVDEASKKILHHRMRSSSANVGGSRSNSRTSKTRKDTKSANRRSSRSGSYNTAESSLRMRAAHSGQSADSPMEGKRDERQSLEPRPNGIANTYAVRRNQARYAENKRRYRQSPRGKYFEARRRAWQRRIPWHFNFESWWQVWQSSGKWEQRGNTPGKYCMCRKGDEGPYAPENCYIGPHIENFVAGNWSPRRIRKGKT